jgi:4-diphosphocytidyl-2-C-methyl-D-erythritol kinase
MSASETAPAKVNLSLHVTGRRDDGYHLLDSLVVFTEIGDRVQAQAGAAGGMTLRVTGPEAAGLSAAGDNLVMRAAQMMRSDGLALTLDKHLPVASGIGGGSSDAAATLRLIAQMTGSPLPDNVLSLGADVPVCLTAHPCRMRGIGDLVTMVPLLPQMAMVLVNPRIGVSTPAVFNALTARDNPAMPADLPAWAGFDAFIHWLAAQRNDLQAPACNLVPEIGHVLTALRDAGSALSRMSGSGATCFGLFQAMTQAQKAADALALAHPGWWVRATGLR